MIPKPDIVDKCGDTEPYFSFPTLGLQAGGVGDHPDVKAPSGSSTAGFADKLHTAACPALPSA